MTSIERQAINELNRVAVLFFVVLGAGCMWLTLTQRVPPPRRTPVVEGIVNQAGWRGAKHGAYVIELVNDSRRFALHTTLIWERLGAPGNVNALGKHVRLVVDKKPHWITGRTFVFALDLDGQRIYDERDVRNIYDRERPKFLTTSIASFFVAGILLWRRKVAKQQQVSA